MRATGDAFLSRIRWSGALAALAALTTLVAIGPPGYAAAATGYDQITGAGSTDSALTVSWKQGLLDNNNLPLAGNAIRSNPTGSLSFMYQDPDFQNLQVIVSQTQNIAHQGITVKWSGAKPTTTFNGLPATNFLQMMECSGDSSSGPSPQNCEFGTNSQLPAAADGAATRQGDLCAANSGPVVGPGIAGQDGSKGSSGCDPQEPVQGASSPDIDPAGAPGLYSIPFVPVGGCAAQQAGCPAYSRNDTNQYYDPFNTNEAEEAVTGSDGTGQMQFETLTSTEASGLGCGQLESNNLPQNCWLVIVPRGQYEPNGYQVNPGGSGVAAYLNSSPLSASNWAMRIQIHLGYAPVTSFCPPGTKEIQTIGTQIVSRAMQSWQLALNSAANCSRIYGYSAVPEATSTQQLAAQGSGVGLAFTTIPVGSEASRPGGTGGTAALPPIVYAPVAVTAAGFGFNINMNGIGYDTTPVKLAPELLAKAFTQVYLYDLPDYWPNSTVVGLQPTLGPAAPGGWAVGNPLNITDDGQFQLLNPIPQILNVPFTFSLAPMETEDHSALNQQIWQWIQADTGASAWLDKGTPDVSVFNLEHTNPDYGPGGGLPRLGTPPAGDSFPRAYTACLNAGIDTAPATGPKPVTRCSLDLIPFVNDYDQAAVNILTGYNPVATIWDSQATAPDGTNGWWDKNPPEPIGNRWIWGITDTADMAAYGIIAAQLCSDSGTNCVGPSTASLTAALTSAQPDSAGLLEVNPASPGAGGYPLTQVVYAAVATNQSAADLSADADLIEYAAGVAGNGQTPGVQAGDLPPGYLPLPANLQNQAKTVVSQLRAFASASASPSSTSTVTSQPSGSGTGTTSLTPSPLSSTSPAAGVSITPPHAELAAQTTRPQPVGAIRWLLMVVVIAGAACAVTGTVLLSAGKTRWLKRMRP